MQNEVVKIQEEVVKVQQDVNKQLQVIENKILPGYLYEFNRS